MEELHSSLVHGPLIASRRHGAPHRVRGDGPLPPKGSIEALGAKGGWQSGVDLPYRSISAIRGQWSETASSGSGFCGGLGDNARPRFPSATLVVTVTFWARPADTRM